MHNVEILGFFWHSDCMWNQLQSFWSPILTTCAAPKNQNSKPSKLLKRQFLTFWNQSKLISHKIRVAGKLLNFQTVEYPQSKFPIWLPFSVICIFSSRIVYLHERSNFVVFEKASFYAIVGLRMKYKVSLASASIL